MREKVQVLDEFWIKVIAIITMTIDHIGIFLISGNADTTAAYQVGFIFRIIGRLSFPLFAFMLAEGLIHSKNRGRYLSRIAIIWGIILLGDIILYSLFKAGNTSFLGTLGGDLDGQAFTDLILYALFIYLLEHPKQKIRPLASLPVIYIVLSYALSIADKFGASTATYFPYFIRAPYSLFGFLIFLGFYYSYKIADKGIKKTLQVTGTDLASYKQTKEYRSLVNIVGVSLFFIIEIIFWGLSYIDIRIDPYETLTMHIQNYCLLDCFILILYNGKRGYDSKGFRIGEYIYYPLHLAIIALIFSLI